MVTPQLTGLLLTKELLQRPSRRGPRQGHAWQNFERRANEKKPQRDEGCATRAAA
jgi:hypothetical protein